MILLVSAHMLETLKGDATPSTMAHSGVTRRYWLHVPDGLPPRQKAPLVLVFHGSGGNGAGMESFCHFSEIADREKFIVVYPDAEAKNWNDGREVAGISSQRDNVDDVGFVEALVGEIAKTQQIDRKRIFAAGFSNGGILVHMLGAKLSEIFAAIAPVGGGIAEPFAPRFKPTAAVSVLCIHGSADPFVPYAGGDVDYSDNGRIISTSETVKMWTEHDGTRAGPEAGELTDKDSADHCRVKWTRWSRGQSGTEVLLYTIDGGGHTWPGGPQFLPSAIIGYVCRDFDAAQLIWDFFKKHPKG